MDEAVLMGHALHFAVGSTVMETSLRYACSLTQGHILVALTLERLTPKNLGEGQTFSKDCIPIGER